MIIATKKELEKKLDEALDSFYDATNTYNDSGKNPATEGELKDVAKQTYYAQNSFKKAILEYLD